jgi:NAD(P)-dependent dehydrogenase (short-subunit alcohol dehydrogenase family)
MPSAPGVSRSLICGNSFLTYPLLICRIDTETAILVNTIKEFDRNKIAALHPLRGVGMPEDLVGAAIFLASNEARWITGVCLPVDGGYTTQ